MDKETKYLIELTRIFLNGSNATLREDIDYYSLCASAKAHNLISVVFSVLNTAKNSSVVPEKCRLSASECFFSGVYIYENQKHAIENIYKVFTKADIPHMLFKGAIIKELYPVPECRLMGDIDILIAEKDRNAAKKALINAGYACTEQNGPVFSYRKGDILLEVHTKMVNSFNSTTTAFDDAFNNAQFEGLCSKPNDSYHFAYLIAHLAHHFCFYGAGIKLILDLAVMLLKCDIDLDYVLKKCDESNLLAFAKIILSICYKWYGVGKNYIDDTQKTEEFIASYGAFGNLNRNKGAVITRRQLEQGKSTSGFATKFALLFPSYKRMKDIPYIPFLEGRPWLLPYAWIYRFGYNTKNRKNFVSATTKRIGDEKTQKEALNEYDFFKEIGLL